MLVTESFIRSMLGDKYGEPAVPRWVRFCRTLMALGYIVRFKQSLDKTSKYIYVSHAKVDKDVFVVRFSTHRVSWNGKKLNLNVGQWEPESALTNAILETTKYFFPPKALEPRKS